METVFDTLYRPLYRHGGRVGDARVAFPQAPEPWIDLSTGVNPVPWDMETAEQSLTLPGADDLTALEAAAASMFGADPSRVAAVPGSDLALRLLPYVLGAKQVGVTGLTYGGHEEAWTNAGATVRILKHGGDPKGLEALVVVNPNNPTGTLIPPAEMMALAVRMNHQDGWLIVDEAFADASPEMSVAGEAEDRLIVLRSFGKFFGRPGLRLGFVIAAPGIVAALRRLLGEWPVSAPAIAAGRGAYADTAWQAATRARLKADAAALDHDLTQAGFSIAGGTTLFRLAARADAEECFRRLGEAGILTRPFAAAPTWLRFGLPGASDRARLQAALRTCA